MWCGGIWVWGGSILAFLGVRLRLKFRNHTFRNHTYRVIVGEVGGGTRSAGAGCCPQGHIAHTGGAESMSIQAAGRGPSAGNGIASFPGGRHQSDQWYCWCAERTSSTGCSAVGSSNHHNTAFA